MSEQTLDSWVKVVDPNYLSAELIGTEGATMDVTITDIRLAECFDERSNSKITKPCVFFAETKPMVLNKTNSKTLKKLFSPNDDDPSRAIGNMVTLKVEKVKAFGKMTDAIRIHEHSSTKCENCGNVIKYYAGKTVAQLVDIAKRNTGKVLCAECMKKFKDEGESK